MWECCPKELDSLMNHCNFMGFDNSAYCAIKEQLHPKYPAGGSAGILPVQQLSVDYQSTRCHERS
jgi:hypothetical protein